MINYKLLMRRKEKKRKENPLSPFEKGG